MSVYGCVCVCGCAFLGIYIYVAWDFFCTKLTFTRIHMCNVFPWTHTQTHTPQHIYSNNPQCVAIWGGLMLHDTHICIRAIQWFSIVSGAQPSGRNDAISHVNAICCGTCGTTWVFTHLIFHYSAEDRGEHQTHIYRHKHFVSVHWRPLLAGRTDGDYKYQICYLFLDVVCTACTEQDDYSERERDLRWTGWYTVLLCCQGNLWEQYLSGFCVIVSWVGIKGCEKWFYVTLLIVKLLQSNNI